MLLKAGDLWFLSAELSRRTGRKEEGSMSSLTGSSVYQSTRRRRYEVVVFRLDSFGLLAKRLIIITVKCVNTRDLVKIPAVLDRDRIEPTEIHFGFRRACPLFLLFVRLPNGLWLHRTHPLIKSNFWSLW